MIKYYKLNRFDRIFNQLKEDKESFWLSTTNYTKKIKHNDTMIFNEDGIPNSETLMLINKVRKDAKVYLNIENKGLLVNEPINWYDLIQRPDEDSIIHKVDLKAAYWTCALRKGVVTDKTNSEFIKMFPNTRSVTAKKSRLKALGSLATSRNVVYYDHGKPVESSQDIQTENTKPIWLDICRTIDRVMKQCAEEVEGCFYYYWDCMFVHHSYSKEVRDFFMDMKYETSVSETKIRYHDIGTNGMIVSIQDGKMYAVKRESKHLLENYDYSIKTGADCFNDMVNFGFVDDRNLKNQLILT